MPEEPGRGAARELWTDAPECLDVLDAIHSTRAIRRLRPDPIPDDVIWQILDAAIRGPSSGNVQRWGWIVVRDQEVKDTIGRWYEEAWDSLVPGRRDRFRAAVGRLVPRLGVAVPERPAVETDRNFASGDHLARNLARAPVWIVPVQQGVHGEPTLVDGADIFGAVQNLLLAARRLGIGGTITMLHRRREPDVRRLLGLPEGVCTVALIPLGYPDNERFSTPRRKPVETVTHWERWGVQRLRSN